MTSPVNPTKHRGIFDDVCISFKHNRAPTTADIKDPRNGKYWRQNTVWLDESTDQPYLMAQIQNNQAVWVAFGTPGPSMLTSLTGDSGGAIPPDGGSNIDVLGDSNQGVSTQGNPGISTLTITVADATTASKGVAQFHASDFDVEDGVVSLRGSASAETYRTDSGDASPAAGILNIQGGEGIDTSAIAPNTVVIAGEDATAAATSGAANKGICSFYDAHFNVTNGFVSLVSSGSTTLYTTDSGNAMPIAGQLQIKGDPASPITTSAPGASNVVQINFAAPLTVPFGGTGRASLTDGAILAGDGTNPVEQITMTDGQVLIGRTGNSPLAAQLTAGPGINITSGSGSIQIATTETDIGIGVSNLGVSYNAGTGVFAITGANGAALSAANPGYVTLPSQLNPGRLITYTITANQDFIDGNGASEIINNTWGLLAADNWNGVFPNSGALGSAVRDGIPMFIYAVCNTAENAIAFMLSRHPGLIISPAAGSIAFPGTPNATTQGSMFSFETIVAANFASRPCLCIGSIRMKKNTLANWFVQTLDNTDGIGRFHENDQFTIPYGVFGAVAGQYFRNNGGTAPQWSGPNELYYSVYRNGVCRYICSSIALTFGGAGAVAVQHVLPFVQFGLSGVKIGSGTLNNTAGNTATTLIIRDGSTGNYCEMSSCNNTATFYTLTNSLVTAPFTGIQFSGQFMLSLT